MPRTSERVLKARKSAFLKLSIPILPQKFGVVMLELLDPLLPFVSECRLRTFLTLFVQNLDQLWSDCVPN